MEEPTKTIELYDTTLRDGSQQRGISFSVEDKLKITQLLDEFGIHVIEGGWPGSNPKDCEYFRRAADLPLRHSRLAAFGSTRRARSSVEDDSNLRALVDANTPIVTIVGKTWRLHVDEVLRTTLDENLAMIADSVRWLCAQGKRVIFDAEHFFDGYRSDPSYALSTVLTAHQAGAETIVLCDTNGGSVPSWVAEVVAAVHARIPDLGIHTHNDGELAVANAIAAVEAGCRQVQGTINGYGERCGNANLISVIPTLQLKLGYECVRAKQLRQLTWVSRDVSEIANLTPVEHAPYVGISAFAHKGGIHVAAVQKTSVSYEHIEPELVGNTRACVISELAGRGNIRMRAAELGLALNGGEQALLDRIKELEFRGFQFENAEGSFELMIRRAAENYHSPFECLDMMVVSERRRGTVLTVEAMVKVKVGDQVYHTVCEGDGPVHALDGAMRKALLPAYPQLADVKLADYKVRILDPESATAATTRVTIEASAHTERWSTVGVNYNIIEASFQALAESFELFLLRSADLERVSLAAKAVEVE